MSRKDTISIILLLFMVIVVFQYGSSSLCLAGENNCIGASGWTENFNLSECSFSSSGRNSCFILEPDYRLELKGIEDNDTVRLQITVLNDTKNIGGVETRVVEERESTNGELVEVSRNYYAFCQTNGSVFYFGEDVDIYKNGKITSHAGGWLADSPDCSPGLMMPGLPLLGSRYYQEIAPGIAMDRAEIVSIADSLRTPAGEFANCLKTEETTPLEVGAREFKYYAPQIGLIKDGSLLLVEYGFIKKK